MMKKRFNEHKNRITNNSKGINKPTIFDVARLAGVSISSVSRVINNSGNVSKLVREMVLDAIEKLNYQPSVIAQGLAKRNINTIAIIVTDITNPFFTELVHSAENKANENGYYLLFCNTDESAEKEAKYIKVLPNHLIAGFIISATRMTDTNIYELKKTNIPFVLINRYLNEDGSLSVRTDFNSGIQKAVEHLINMGHRNILLLNGPKNSQASQLREEAYIDAIIKHGLTYNPKLNRSYQPTIESGFNGILEAIDNAPDFTAIIAYNDLMAIGALDALRSRKIKVPEAIAIVSFDDTILSRHSCPPLTSIRQDSGLLGRLAVEMLINNIEGKEIKVHDIVLDPELIIRDSSATPIHRKS
jgi:LacI family transcriptional regulator